MRFNKRLNASDLSPKKRPKPLEKHIERAICDYFRIKGLWVFKIDSMGVYDVQLKRFRSNNNPYRIKGCGDLAVIYDGIISFCEIKRPGAVQTDSQIEFERLCKINNVLYFVLHSVEEAEAAYQRIMRDLSS